MTILSGFVSPSGAGLPLSGPSLNLVHNASHPRDSLCRAGPRPGLLGTTGITELVPPFSGVKYFIVMQSDCISCDFSYEFWKRAALEWDDGNVARQYASRDALRDDNADDAIRRLAIFQPEQTTPLRPIVQGGYT